MALYICKYIYVRNGYFVNYQVECDFCLGNATLILNAI